MTARVFVNGRSQAVRIPKEYRFDVDEVFVNKVGDALILIPEEALARTFEQGLSLITQDFMLEGRAIEVLSEREEL